MVSDPQAPGLKPVFSKSALAAWLKPRPFKAGYIIKQLLTRDTVLPGNEIGERLA